MSESKQRFNLPSGEIVFLTLNEFLDWLVINGPVFIEKKTGEPVIIFKLTKYPERKND